MTSTNAHLTTVDLPDFGMPTATPQLPADVYAVRVDAARRRAQKRGFDTLVIYADREHSANLSHLTGFDPRFEEAVLFLGDGGDPLLLTGIECVAMGSAAPLPMRVELHSDLSLAGMPRRPDRTLADIIAGEGIRRGSRVGVVGWKAQSDADWIEVPAYIVDALRAAVGPDGMVANAGGLLSDPVDGLRTTNEVEQLAAFEYAACHTSEGLKRLLFGLRPGMTEQEAVGLLRWPGAPLSCHLMLSSGPRATLGLLSPSDRVIEQGDRFTTAYGLWGSLDCRAGFVVAGADELPAAISDYAQRLVAPYFDAVAEWLEALHVGQTGGTLHAIVDRHLGDPFFGVHLTPGHLIGLEEWLHSPIAPGSDTELRSGMVLQLDVIPATGTDYFTTNIEGPFAVADEPLRQAIERRYPEMWQRIQARRAFMRDGLGIDLHPDVLPFSNLPAYLPPFLLRPDQAMVR